MLQSILIYFKMPAGTMEEHVVSYGEGTAGRVF